MRRTAVLGAGASKRLLSNGGLCSLLLTLVLVVPSLAAVPLAQAQTTSEERIHVLAFPGSDAIILESNGRFAFVDSGEDRDYPSGSDPRYPARPGITGAIGYEDELWSYLDQLGVNSTNVEFYLGTHPHSDHIGTADTVIERYKPKRIYTPEYKDEWIREPSRLWDNQYVYDQMIEAAQRAYKSYGASLIQHLDPQAPAVPTAERPHTASPEFDFEDMHIQIVNYQEDYKYPGAMFDANQMAWGVKVTSHGKSAFLAADIENTDGDEDRIAPEVGEVDFLKLGHHGSFTSSSEGFLETLKPQIAVQTGMLSYFFDETVRILDRQGSRWYSAQNIRAEGNSAVVLTMDESGLGIDGAPAGVVYRTRRAGSPHAIAYQGGRPSEQHGWRLIAGRYYWFDNSAYASEDSWVRDGSAWYYLRSDAVMATGWAHDGEAWYYFSDSGAMLSGWQRLGGVWYYLEPSGRMATGWRLVGGSWYYFSGSGAMATGWAHDGEAWYYFSDSGAMLSGWQRLGGVWYYLEPSGRMATGWRLVGGSWYYFSGSGAMATGWAHDGEAWYYFSDSGAMRTGWLASGRSWFYLTGSGAMATGIVMTDGRYSHFGSSGVWLGYL
ncbi:MBL fold metallo-hydrolase [Actinomyces faecalis]|uniref:MBL fold metallo-hydrolase n=1 Tax=Actinomyces faecalis TaxID=2722820 RepID=UPI0015524000|nr:MBL fold metallo-hydrolase [Actinomyces faecalis]